MDLFKTLKNQLNDKFRKKYLTTKDPYRKRVQKNFKIWIRIPEIWEHFFLNVLWRKFHLNYINFFQTQSCNWRNPKSKNVIRQKRDLIEDEERTKALNKSLSESVSLFQAIHVLQTDEDESTYTNTTNAGKNH